MSDAPVITDDEMYAEVLRAQVDRLHTLLREQATKTAVARKERDAALDDAKVARQVLADALGEHNLPEDLDFTLVDRPKAYSMSVAQDQVRRVMAKAARRSEERVRVYVVVDGPELYLAPDLTQSAPGKGTDAAPPP